jgi:vacuolar-type H+-ATPase subunit I/STV1
MTIPLAIAGEENLIKTVDYVSNQGVAWILTAVLFICGAVVLFLMRRILEEAKDQRKELKELNEKHIEVLEKSAIAMADNAAEVRLFGKQVANALENSTSIIKSVTEAINDNTDATKLQIKAADATTTALVDLTFLTNKTASEVRSQGDDSESAIRRNTEALEAKKQQSPPGRKQSKE